MRDKAGLRSYMATRRHVSPLPMLTTNPFETTTEDGDTLREECGVFGVSGSDSAAALVALGLHALQHRGQEAAGISSFDGTLFHTHRAMGHVAGNFDRDDVIRALPGTTAVGHVRYSTTGETALRNVQPLYADLSTGGFAVAHNGNISNAMKLRRELVRRGSIFQSTSDTETIIHLVATSNYRTLLDRFIDALKQVEGAYSLVVMTPEGMIACRDPLGIRPLVMGRLDGAVIFASETVALDVCGATFERQVEPGELVIVQGKDIRSIKPFAEVAPRPCIFEYIYFARPDSMVGGRAVYDVRKSMGAELAREAGVAADVVVPVPVMIVALMTLPLSALSPESALAAVAAVANMRVISVLISAPSGTGCQVGFAAGSWNMGRVGRCGPGGTFDQGIHGNDGGNEQDHLQHVDRQIGGQRRAQVKRGQRVADDAAQRHADSGSRGLNRTPGAERQAALRLGRAVHGGRQRAMTEQASTKTNQHHPQRKQGRTGLRRRRCGGRRLRAR